MATKAPAIVRVDDGRLGTIIEPEPETSSGQLPLNVDILLEDGQRMMVSSDLLAARPDGSYELALGPAEATIAEGNEIIVPVVAETAEVGKRRVETGRVRVRKTVRADEKVVDESLMTEDVEVVRVPINRVITEPVGPRQEGETLIVPLLEEILVVEKRLVLREELRITRRRVEHRSTQKVVLRTEEATVERSEAESPQPDE